jgi:hypothetical protein
MAIYLIPLFLFLPIALIPCIIQLLVCLATDKFWIRLIPVTVSALVMAFWAFLILDGYFPMTSFLGYTLDWMMWISMLSALAIGHGLPFLILGLKK